MDNLWTTKKNQNGGVKSKRTRGRPLKTESEQMTTTHLEQWERQIHEMRLRNRVSSRRLRRKRKREQEALLNELEELEKTNETLKQKDREVDNDFKFLNKLINFK